MGKQVHKVRGGIILMENIIIETVVQIFAALLLMLISLLGTWLTAKLAKRTELANIAPARD